MASYKVIACGGFSSTLASEEKKIIDVFNEMGQLMQEICHEVPGLNVFSFVIMFSLHLVLLRREN